MNPGSRADNADPRRTHLVALFETDFDSVYRFALARCGDEMIAEDIASETFQAAASALAAGQETSIGRPWLYVVARRRLVDHWRRTERERRRVLRVLEWGEAHGQKAVPDDRLGDSSDAVLAALRSLPPRQRIAVALRYLDDYSVSEVAESLDVPYRAAESLLARGRKSFIDAWEAQ